MSSGQASESKPVELLETWVIELVAGVGAWQ